MAVAPDLPSRQRGSVVLVFDSVLWGGRDVGDNSQFLKPATILEVGRTRDKWRDLVATVRFHHDGRVSRGHFVDGMRDIEGAGSLAA